MLLPQFNDLTGQFVFYQQGFVVQTTATINGVSSTYNFFTTAVQDAGSTGQDFSTGLPTLPDLGSNFPSSGSPFANYQLQTTIPATAARCKATIENLTNQPLLIIRDDGTALAGFAMTNASIFEIAAPTFPGDPNARREITTFKGRLNIYAPAGFTGTITANQE